MKSSIAEADRQEGNIKESEWPSKQRSVSGQESHKGE